MTEMTSRERILRTYKHLETDRVPFIDEAWRGTIARWQREGLPADTRWEDYFGLDKTVTLRTNNSPRFEERVIEKTDRYSIVTNPWGATRKVFNELDSTPETLDFYYSTSDRWQECKERILSYSDDRIPWKQLEENYDRWKKEGYFIQIGLWFGFDVAHSGLIGTENMLISMYDEPEWVTDIFETYLTASLDHAQKIIDAGYEIDGIKWWDDMGYKGTTFFSPTIYRELLKPYHKRAVDWAHERGLVAELHSCGHIETLIPDIVEIGVDMLNPLEVKAGMDPQKLKAEWGKSLAFHGGINAQIWDDADKVISEMERIVPIMKEGGGYVFASDHSIPNSVSFSTMCKIAEKLRELGRYR